MHKIKFQGLKIEKFQLIPEDGDSPGQIHEMSADLSRIEFSKSFSENINAASDFNHLQPEKPFETI